MDNKDNMLILNSIYLMLFINCINFILNKYYCKLTNLFIFILGIQGLSAFDGQSFTLRYSASSASGYATVRRLPENDD